jgi:hypothetical protein
MMRKAMDIPEAISSRNKFKRKFSLREMYLALVKIPGAISKMIGNNRSKLVDKNFIECLHLLPFYTGFSGKLDKKIRITALRFLSAF